MKRFFNRNRLSGSRAQAMVEFAIALPILLALLVGIFEVGRMVFIYAAVNNASREAVRYASAIGREDTYGYEKYRYCDGIRQIATRSAYVITLTAITITYDAGPSTSSLGTCDQIGGEDPNISVDTGDRVQVTVQADYEPMLTLIPLSPRTFTSRSARTILGILELDSSTGPTNTSVPSGPSNTPGPSATPTATVLSATPTATDASGPLITFTPLPSSTPTTIPTSTLTRTPTNTPTITSTPTETSTPTSTPTAVPGCGSITSSSISISGNLMSMTITNPHDSITVSNVQVMWNPTGGPSGSSLVLQYASLEGIFWSGNDSSGSLTITPSTTLTIPGNNTTSTIIFTFNKAYKTPGTYSIVINLSTPGCESFPIQRP